MNISLSNKLVSIFLSALILALSFYPILSKPVFAASLTAISDTMTRQDDTTASNHTFSFTFDSGTSVIENETIIITFPAAFDTSTIDCGDIDITDDAVDEDVQEEAGSCTANATEWGAAFASDVLTLTAPSTSSTYINGSSVVTVEIGTNATADEAGNEQIVNPGTPGSNTISIAGNFGDTGSLAVPIMSDDQVTVSATVDPSVTSALSTTTCSLGILTISAISFCSYTNTVSTNATSGYVSTIVENGNLCSPSVAVCTNNIDDETGDGDVDQGTEEYGVSSNDTVGTQTVVDSTGCDDSGTAENATSITGTAKVYADSGDGDAGPVSAAVTTLCHSASIIGATPAGSYSHIVTHITTATF